MPCFVCALEKAPRTGYGACKKLQAPKGIKRNAAAKDLRQRCGKPQLFSERFDLDIPEPDTTTVVL